MGSVHAEWLLPTDPRNVQGKCKAMRDESTQFEGTFSAWKTGRQRGNEKPNCDKNASAPVAHHEGGRCDVDLYYTDAVE
ncbi:hypothetical protein K438DRAFT_1993003 [Mycena galopus ATCC 62051]|nr:hypothetical protein K438DRAFT_1993003 [Mycena galopus ATCC 62051]